MSRRIVWAVTREEFALGRSLLTGANVVNSNLNLFDKAAEKAEAVLILESHPKAEACAKFYKKQGADVELFSLPKKEEEQDEGEEVAPAPKRQAAPKKPASPKAKTEEAPKGEPGAN